MDGLGEPRWVPKRDRSCLGSHLMFPSPFLWQELESPSGARVEGVSPSMRGQDARDTPAWEPD